MLTDPRGSAPLINDLLLQVQIVKQVKKQAAAFPKAKKGIGKKGVKKQNQGAKGIKRGRPNKAGVLKDTNHV